MSNNPVIIKIDTSEVVQYQNTVLIPIMLNDVLFLELFLGNIFRRK